MAAVARPRGAQFQLSAVASEKSPLSDETRRLVLGAERSKYRGDDARGRQSCELIHALGLVLVDEDVRQHKRPHFPTSIEQAARGQELQHVAAEATDRALLDRH